MDESANFQANDMRANELLRAGWVASAQGNRKQAHHLWRQAASLRPEDEQIWLALLNVVENDEDRRVCLENILRINPKNAQARRHLRSYDLLQGISQNDFLPPSTFPQRMAKALIHILKLAIAVLIIAVLCLVLGVVAIRLNLLWVGG